MRLGTKQTVSRARVGHQQQNELAARLILLAIAHYGGEGSLAVIWARAYLARVERDDWARIGPLFKAA